MKNWKRARVKKVADPLTEEMVTKRLEELEVAITELRRIISEKDKNWDYDRPFDEYWEHIGIETDLIAKFDREKRRIMPYVLAEIPDFGDVMSLDDFIENVNVGNFIDYDGHGYYVKDGKETNVMIIPSDIKIQLSPKRIRYDCLV